MLLLLESLVTQLNTQGSKNKRSLVPHINMEESQDYNIDQTYQISEEKIQYHNTHIKF